MKNINVIAIIGAGYVSHINFNEVVSFVHYTDLKEVYCQFRHQDNYNCYQQIKYTKVIEVKYLGE